VCSSDLELGPVYGAPPAADIIREDRDTR
jgi:hypothetical protein